MNILDVMPPKFKRDVDKAIIDNINYALSFKRSIHSEPYGDHISEYIGIIDHQLVLQTLMISSDFVSFSLQTSTRAIASISASKEKVVILIVLEDGTSEVSTIYV